MAALWADRWDPSGPNAPRSGHGVHRRGDVGRRPAHHRRRQHASRIIGPFIRAGADRVDCLWNGAGVCERARAAGLASPGWTHHRAGEQRRYLARTIALARRCGDRNGELLAHIATADTDQVFQEFLRLCETAGPDRCALAGHGPVAARVGRLLAELRRSPIPVPSGELTYGEALTARKYSGLPDPALWPQVAAVLELAVEGDASVLDAIAAGATSDHARVLLQEQGGSGHSGGLACSVAISRLRRVSPSGVRWQSEP